MFPEEPCFKTIVVGLAIDQFAAAGRLRRLPRRDDSLLSTAKPNRLGLPPVLPQTATSASASIAISIPLARAARVLPIADLDLAVGAAAGAVNIQTTHLAVHVHAHAIRVLLDGDIVVLVTGTVCVIVALEFERNVVVWLLARADTMRWLQRHSAGLLVHAIILWLGAAEPERLEVGATRPKLSASMSAAVAVAVPVARAAGTLPVAYPDLAIRTAAKAGNIQRADLAVCVYACRQNPSESRPRW